MPTYFVVILVVVAKMAVALFNGWLARRRCHSMVVWTVASFLIVPSLLAVPLVLIYCRNDNVGRVP